MPEPLANLESNLNKLFGSGSSYQLASSTKKSLARAAWWIALIIGLLQLWAAWALWQLGHVANTIIDYSNYVSATYGNGMVVRHLGFFYYLAFTVILVDAGLLLLAVSALKAFKKPGWDLLYYSLLLNVLYGVVRVFSTVGGGIGQLIFQLFVSAVIAYFLFQIRSAFVEAHHHPSKTVGHKG